MSVEKKENLDNCPFCRILAGKDNQSERTIYSDNNFMGMLVQQPRSRGHFILFPRIHAGELNDMTEMLGLFFTKAHELAEEFTKKLGAPAYEMKLNNNIFKLENDPNHVGHIHMHIVPRYSGEIEPVSSSAEYYFQLMRILQHQGNGNIPDTTLRR